MFPKKPRSYNLNLQKLSIDDMISPSKKTTHIHPTQVFNFKLFRKKRAKKMIFHP
jgi:hypothetical protein